MGWPLGIGVVLAALVVFNVWVAIIASDPNASAVEPEYYRKAVAWDDVARQQAVNTRLGWVIATELAPGLDAKTRELRVTVRDAAGVSINGAVVRVVAIHNARAAHPVTATLSGRGAGVYTALLALDRFGQWELRFEVARGGDLVTASVRVELAGAAGP